MFNVRRVFAFWAFLAMCTGATGRAEAQATVSVTLPATGAIIRDHQDGAGRIPITQVNYKDCLNNDVAHVTVNLSAGYNNYSLEAWAGDACDTKTNRIGALATCWRVFSGQPNNVVYKFDISIREMLSGRTGGNSIGTGGTGGTGGADSGGGGTGGADATGGTDSGGGGTGGTDATTGGTEETAGGSTAGASTAGASAAGASNVPADAPSACITTSAATAPQPLTVFFMLVDGGSNSVGGASWAIKYKLNASPPPDSVSSGTGENIAPISWDYDGTTADQYINGYQLYCDPSPGRSGALEAGVLPEEGSTVLPTECPPSTVLFKGTRPADKYKCGTADKASNRGIARDLVNNVAYNVAVATMDTYLNVGVISETACAIPQPVTGFFEAYRDAGGEGGGGFCSFSRHGQPLILISLLGTALGLVLRRRRAT